MTVNKYPEDIYPKLGFRTDGFGRLTYRTTFNSDFERAYDLGYQDGQQAQGDHPLAGWSNLTEAIKTGEHIDWDALDGKEICFKHIDGSLVKDSLIRDHSWDASDAAAWVLKHHQLALGVLFRSCFDDGRDGWSLWIKGYVPLRKLTADQLEPGTCFRARYEKNGETHNYAWAQLLKPSGQKPRIIFLSQALTTLFGSALPEDVEVVEVYGPGAFDTPKGDA